MARTSTGWDPVCPPPSGLVRPVRLDPTGRTGPTRGQAHGSRWRRSSHGWYVPATTDATRPEQRILEASVHLPAGAAVTGWAALRLAGAAYFDGREPDGSPTPVPVAVGPGRGHRRRDGVRFRQDFVAPDEERFGVPVTTVRRALFDQMRGAPDLRAAVVAADMAAAARLTTVERIGDYLGRCARRTGVAGVRRALALADDRSASPAETRLRLAWTLDAGLPRPLVNQPVWTTEGRLLGYADLLDAATGLVGEYDGADHRGAWRQSRDEDRTARMRDHGLEVVRFTAPDLADPARSGGTVARILGGLDRAARQPCRWTVVAPEGWRDDELPLDLLLDLLEGQT